ncbi:MAG: PKD domain-containing protein [Bacteroidia bacterium]|nr:PKD domain-containing protein [Bacteroidia bacterium]
MNKFLPRCLSIFLFSFLLSVDVSAQRDVKTIDMNLLNQKKAQGLLTGTERFVNNHPDPLPQHAAYRIPYPQAQTASASCDCWVPRDATWQIAQFDGSGGSGGPGTPPLYRNDDWSTVPIAFPFPFCFYSSTIDSLYINNNGNVSFGTPYSTFTPDSFPSPNFVMIAPFWGDVDTRAAGSDVVYYQLTPTHLIVQWEHVGYYGNHDDKLNTFQLILTNGADPILPSGNNVSFCYKDMQWTTGDASSGVNGFGGSPATVGVNQGNGIDYIQMGRFDAPGTFYDGPFGAHDGVDVLDNQSFYFNVCVSGTSNIPPIINSVQVCDTLTVCVHDTLYINVDYLSPEQGQITTASINANGMNGVSVFSNTPGNTASMTVQVIGSSANVGYNTIDLIGTDNGNPVQTSISPIVIHVIPAPVAGFTFNPPSPVMAGTTVNFTNSSTGGFSYSWDFGDGSPPSSNPNPPHIYGSGGTYTVTLTVTSPNGCTDVIQQQITITQCATASFTTNNVCAGVPSTITYTGTGGPSATYNWTFSGGTVVSGTGAGPYNVVWNSPGTYNVTLDVTQAGCTSPSFTGPVTVYDLPVAAISATPSVCTGADNTVTFTGTAIAGATFIWDFGSGSVSSGSGAGPYTVQWASAGPDTLGVIVTQNGCPDTADFPVTIHPIPTATFTVPASVCPSTPLTASYSGSASAGASYTWDFNGASQLSGNGQGPYSIQWSQPGSYNVSLTVTENGCTSPPVSHPVTVNTIPVASINATPSLCIGAVNTISFNGTAGPGATYTWNFGTGTVASGSGPGPYAVTWSGAGNEVLHLTVTENGCVDSVTSSVLIYPIPTADFQVTPDVCINQASLITYQGSATGAAVYSWNFGTGNIVSGTGAGPYSVSWSTGGQAQVDLTVTENGCTSAPYLQNIMVHGLPVVNAGTDAEVCSGVQVALGSASQAGFTYSWSPGTGLSDPGVSNPQLILDNTGGSPLTTAYVLTATDNFGCVNSDTAEVRINPVPAIVFDIPASQCLSGNVFTFTPSGTLFPGITYNWNFGSDATIATSDLEYPFPVSFSTTGLHTITLNTEFNGCAGPLFQADVDVFEMPVSTFEPLVVDGCEPLEVPFSNSSSGNGNTYHWIFSDGGTSDQEVPVHTFHHAGTYSVTLITTTSEGCQNVLKQNDIITVYPVPQASFYYTPSTPDILEPFVQFENTTLNGTQYLWDFGDSSTSTAVHPRHTFARTGSYTVTLMVNNDFGCHDTVRSILRVSEGFTFYAPNAFTPNGDGVNDNFSGYGTNIGRYDMYIFDRWGNQVFHSDSMKKPWNGRVDDNPVQNEVYNYRFVISDLFGQQHIYFGKVTVIR